MYGRIKLKTLPKTLSLAELYRPSTAEMKRDFGELEKNVALRKTAFG